MTIGELSRKTGIAPSAIRYYEEQKLIPAPVRRSGKRIYDGRAVLQLTVVLLARDAGFRVAEVRQLVTEFGEHRWRKLARRKLDETRAAMDRLRTMSDLLERLLECECPDMEFCGRVISKAKRRRAR